MPMENPDIIQLGGLIRTPDQLGYSPYYHSQTGLDIGDDASQPGANGAGRTPPLSGSSTDSTSFSTKFKAFTAKPEAKILAAGVMALAIGVFIGRNMK